jgi:hypothetical protein
MLVISTSSLLRRLRDEQGGVLVGAAIVALAMVLLGAVVIQVGAWFQHRRHIQVRADSAALSGGQVLSECFNIPSTTTEPTVDADIESWAKNYGGLSSAVSTQSGAPYNMQFGTSSSNLMSFQSDTYPSAGSPTPTRNLGNECFNADGTSNLLLDVKMAQEGIPSLFSFVPLATVHSWARVQLQTITSLIPSLPLAIPDVNPKAVAVTFVDDSTGQALPNCSNECVFPLSGPTTSSGLNAWGGTATIPVPATPNTNIGVRVSIGSTAGSCAGINSMATYKCYVYSTGGQPSNGGIIRIRAYNGSGSGSTTAPILRAVSPATCSGTPFFSAYSAPSGSCSASVSADVDFGSSVDYTKARVRATVNGTTYLLTHQSGLTWVSPAFSLPVAGGPYDVTLDWIYGNGGNWSHFASGNAVQQIFAGGDGSDSNDPGGPILAASVVDSGGNPAYSLPAGSSATLVVSVGLSGGVHLAQRCSNANGNSGANYRCASDPPVALRFQTPTASGTTSGSYSVDCGTLPGNTGPDLYQQIRYGCAKRFSVNSADVCPDPANPTPPDCAPVQPGGRVGQLQQAMNDRFAPGGVCDANSYPTVNENDPRVVELIDTDFSAFSGSGGNSASDVPVVTFASFYVTGRDGGPSPSSCSSFNEPAPPGLTANGNTANVWGHFIKYESNNGNPSGKKCDVTAVAPCVAGLVR